MSSSISSVTEPEPKYGIGVLALITIWIDREIAQRAAGLTDAARLTKIMRRELQEAAGLVADPQSTSLPPVPVLIPGHCSDWTLSHQPAAGFFRRYLFTCAAHSGAAPTAQEAVETVSAKR